MYIHKDIECYIYFEPLFSTISGTDPYSTFVITVHYVNIPLMTGDVFLVFVCVYS